MTTQFTPILQLALPVTGELNGTWGDVVNDNITSMVEQAIAGLATISTWTTNSHTLTTADGVTDEARCAMLVAQTGAGGTALTGVGQIICPARTKLFVMSNASAYAVTLKTAAGTGISVPAGDTAFLFCDGTNVNPCVTTIVNGHISGNLTVDGNTTLGDSSADTVTINAGSTTLNDGGAIRFEDNAGGEYVALKAPATVTATYTLTLPIDDGVNGQALITDGSGNLSWSTAASGDVYGPATATDNAVARFDGTTGKLIQNSVFTIADDGASVLSVNSSSDGLRITQTGTGNALVVEDSANPDATPFVVDPSGVVGIGLTNPSAYTGSGIVVKSGSAYSPQNFLWNSAADNSGSYLIFRKDRNGAVVQNGDSITTFNMYGYDGASYINAASIEARVDGTPGTNDMPGRLVFSTTADGASSPTERMRIDSAGRVGIGGIPAAGFNLNIAQSITGATTTYGLINQGSIKNDVTSAANIFTSAVSTQATAFTLSNLRHFFAYNTSIGAGSTVGSQYGFYAESTLTGATNNYGFYSNIASGTGRYNFYAAGTADNFMAGRLGVGAAPSSTQFYVDVTNSIGNDSGIRTINASAGAGATAQFQASNGTSTGWFGIGGTGYSGYGQIRANGLAMYTASAAGIGFSADNASGYITFGTGAGAPERMRIDNAGRVGIGATPFAGTNLFLGKSITGATTSYGMYLGSPILSDVTGTAIPYYSVISTQAAAFTLANLAHFKADQSTIGAGSSVTTQYGFNAGATLTGATNNYGFYSSIAAGTGRYNFYAAGTADNYFAGKVGIGSVASTYILEATQNQNATSAIRLVNNDAGASASARFLLANGTTEGGLILRGTGASTANQVTLFTNSTTDPITFFTNGSERMRIDSSGNVIHAAPTTAPTLATNGTMVFNLTSDTNLRVSVRGSDGVTRTANITLA